MRNNNISLHAFFERLLRCMRNAEQDISKQLEIICHLAKEVRFKQGLEKHRQETLSQIQRLEQALILMGLDIEEKKEGLIENAKEIFEKGKEMVSDLVAGFVPKSPSIQGIVKEGKELFEEFQNTEVHDLVLSSGVQSIEMGEIASYKTLCQIAEQCASREVLDLLQTSLKEEEDQFNLLSEITEEELKKFKKQEEV